MRGAVIHNLPDWQVTSYGNGLAYEVANKSFGMAIFFQGDDADYFRDALQGMTENRTPSLDYATALAVLWHDYSDSAAQWRQPA